MCIVFKHQYLAQVNTLCVKLIHEKGDRVPNYDMYVKSCNGREVGKINGLTLQKILSIKMDYCRLKLKNLEKTEKQTATRVDNCNI
jgi:hypothetical protein